VTYGYNWAGPVEGEIIVKGTPVKVKGAGIRERYVAVDSSAAELGGWEDWGWIAFNEIHSSMYDMRLGMKDFAMYDLETGKYYPEGKMTINHEDWAFMRELDGFIPMTYKISIEIEDGLYEVEAHTCNATTWGATHKVPDMPVATITYDKVEGRFTHNDGTVRILTGGPGTVSVRLWAVCLSLTRSGDFRLFPRQILRTPRFCLRTKSLHLLSNSPHNILQSQV
jgi:hypothetical protein